MNIKKRRSFAAVLVAGVIGLVATPLSAQAATIQVSVDCTTNAQEEHWRYVANADTVTYTVTNCTDVETFDNDWNSQSSATLTGSTFVGTPGHNYEFYNSSDRGGTWYDSRLLPSVAEHTPSGSLLLTKEITIGTSPSQMDVGAPNNPDNDYEHNLAGIAQCGLQADLSQQHVYSKVTITIKKAGTYTFRGTVSNPASGYLSSDEDHSPLSDPMLALYKNFDPTHPDANVVGCEDDLNDLFDYTNNDFAEELPNGVLMEGHQPYFSVHLQPGVYNLLLLTWDSMSADNWAAGDNGNFTFTPGAESTTIQMWGPTGGLVEGAVELANTGSVIDTSLLFACVLLVLAGAGLVAVRTKK